MTLTEQWKKGELPYGYYYIKTISGGEVIDRYYRDCTDYDLCEYGNVWENRFEDEIIKVLAPVPTYAEWQKMKEQRDACAWALDKIGDVLVKHKLVEKIDNAIGENK